MQKTSSRLWQFATNLFLTAGLGLALVGCVSDKVADNTVVTRYQRALAQQGPQPRQSEGENPADALGVLEPVAPAEGGLPELAVTVDPNTGQKTVKLTLEEAITRTLANSPEIRVVSFDPEIARQEIAKAAGAFDPVIFNQDSWDDQDSPKNSSWYDTGRADRRLFESGVRQRTPLGSEWSASYAFARNWDDLWGRALSTRYEPMLIFQLKQPLLRDGWPEVNMAGVDIARLGHQIALVGFRNKAESLAATVIAAYWQLVQVRRVLEIQQQLVDETLQALHKVDGRREIDATDVQLMQVRAYAKMRQADLVLVRQQVKNAQDTLAALLASPQINAISTMAIVPVTALELPSKPPEAATLVDQALATAMQCNPAMQEARMRIQIAEINVKVAENQRLPRLDLTGSARAQSLAATSEEAHEQLGDRQYTSYSIGLSFEQPLGNRTPKAELNLRRIELHKAVAILHSAADQIAIQVKDRARKAQATLEQVTLQNEAAQAAADQLKALEESEPIRDKLTPEFMLVKLQAQETYAETQRAEIEALTQFNVSLAELARTTGTVLQLHQVERALTAVTPPEPQPEPQVYGPQEQEREVPELLPAGILYSWPAKLK